MDLKYHVFIYRLFREYSIDRVRESMTLFEVDRVFWTRQDFKASQDRSPDKSRKLYPPRKGSWILFSPVHHCTQK